MIDEFNSEEKVVQTKYGTCCYKYENGVAIIYDLCLGPKDRDECHAKSALLDVLRKIKADGYDGDIYIKPNPGKDGVKEERYDRFFGLVGLRVLK